MDANPNDVVTLLIVNSDDFEPTAFDTLFKAAGLDTLSYVPPSASITNEQWPTLGSMISNGTRLVTFLDAMADFTSVTYLMAGMFIFLADDDLLTQRGINRIYQRLGNAL